MLRRFEEGFLEGSSTNPNLIPAVRHARDAPAGWQDRRAGAKLRKSIDITRRRANLRVHAQPSRLPAAIR